jgi:hypothetical protein
MPRRTHYSPCINRNIVRALYHEAKHRRLPMTRLTNQLLAVALQGTVGWKLAHTTPALQEPTTDGSCVHTR